MAINFEYQYIGYKLRLAGMHKYWLKKVIRAHKQKPGNINYIFCTDAQLLEINKEYLNHDYYTDIITFDYTEDKTLNGDLYISVDTVKSNATEYKVRLNEEMRRVMVHGLLHLLGYNDKTDSEIAAMRKAEHKWLNAYKWVWLEL